MMFKNAWIFGFRFLVWVALTGVGGRLSAQTVAIISDDETWNYRKATEEPSSPREAWRLPGFDDSGWVTGAAPFFYESNSGYSGNTELIDMRGGYTGIYLRKSFDIANPAAMEEMTLRIASDDGCVIWLNGKEVDRINAPSGDLGPEATALGASGEPNTAELILNPAEDWLQSGENILAIHALNASLSGSSDFLISASLTTEIDIFPPEVVDIAPAPGAIVRTLTGVEIVFDDNVTGVDAADLLVNGVPADRVMAYSPRDYGFEFGEPPVGEVLIRWADGHGITDLAANPNLFAGGEWMYELNPEAPASRVVLSEFLADNENGIRDEDGEREDWIELLNLGPAAVNLAGWYLTDDRMNLTQWRFPAIDLDVNEYFVVWASGKDRYQAGALHTNFRLNRDGEYLALVDPSTNVISEFVPAYPPQRPDISYGRDRLDPDLQGFFPEPTPGGPNGTRGEGFAPEVTFSLPAGVYGDATVEVELTAPSGVIRYTLDGTPPTSSSAVYRNSLRLSQSTTVKARVFETGLLPGPVGVSVYHLVDAAVQNFSSNLPLLIIDTSGQSIPQDRRITASLTAIDTFRGRAEMTATPQFQGVCEVEIRGQTSAGFPKKPYNLETDDPYGNDLEVPLVGLPAESDWALQNPYSDKSFMNNVLAFELHEQMGHYAVRRRYVEVFVNTTGGRLQYPRHYAGLYVLLEKIKVDNNRVDIARLTPADREEPEITGGYIIKKDKSSPGDRTFRTQGGAGFSGQELRYHEPKPREITPVQEAWIRNYLNEFEAALYAPDWLTRTGADHYSHYIDVDSFVDNHWIVEFSKQIDGYRLSNYMHKDRGGKLKMDPIWDWNLSFGNADYNEGDQTSGWYYDVIGENQHIWLRRLINGNTSRLGGNGDPDFLQRIADRWSVLRTNIFNADRVNARIDELAALIDEAQERDFNKWPRLNDYVWPNPPYYITRTFGGIISAKKQWIRQRYQWIDSQYLLVPEIGLPGGRVLPGTTVSLTHPDEATIYYTLDGSDPRASGGGMAPGVRSYSQPISLNRNTRLVARAMESGQWSGPVSALYTVAVPTLRITEIMFHPAAPPEGSPYTDEDFEFLELKNTGTAPLDLEGFHFGDGVEFTFGPDTASLLDPDERILLVRNRAAVESRYGNVLPIAGEYLGSLANDGERLLLLGPVGEMVQEFRYDDDWFPAADGLGFSLEPRAEDQPLAAWDSISGWRLSAQPGGSPGVEGAAPAEVPVVLVNEALTHTDDPMLDSIELHNPGNDAVDLEGWWLSDDFNRPKFRIPAGTVVPGGGYVVFNEGDFNLDPSAPESFNLRSTGDEAYLFSGDKAGNLTGYVHGFGFGGARNGVSFGRYVTADGEEHFVAQSEVTLGRANAGPGVGPVVISEIMYHPPEVPANGRLWDDTEHEFVELTNLGPEPVPMFNPESPELSWRLRGAVDFDFPANFTLAGGERILVVAFDPSDPDAREEFESYYEVPANLRVLGPFDGKLRNSGEELELILPETVRFYGAGTQEADVVMDAVDFNDRFPWPAGADGYGPSLQRVNEGAYGNESVNWLSASPTPGGPASFLDLPQFVSQPEPWNTQPGQTVELDAEATGLEPIRYEWRFDGESLPDATGTPLVLENIQTSQDGLYQVVAINPAGATAGIPVRVTVTLTTQIVNHPQPTSALPGLDAQFHVNVASPRLEELTFQWRRNGDPIPGATEPILVIEDVTSQDDAYYDVMIRDGASVLVSESARLTVLLSPQIVTPPVSMTVLQGSSVTLSIGTAGTLPMGYRWRRNGQTLHKEVLDRHESFLTLADIQPEDAGPDVAYSCLLTNAASYLPGVLSPEVHLTILPDSDGDGMADDWEEKNQLNPNNPDDAEIDSDGDGMTNREEHIAGTNPQDKEDYLRYSPPGYDDTVVLEFHAVANHTYSVQYHDALTTSPWETLQSYPAASTNRTIRLADPDAHTSRFYRLATPAQP